MAGKRSYEESNGSGELVCNEAESEETLSMIDVLAEQNEIEESASAVLGGSDDKNCTYQLGYVKRQALYSCKTCALESGKGRAGICLACSLGCHEGHEMVELYTKRNFRCDCGNGKFSPSFKCKLVSVKTAENEFNHYNQNFSGDYCSCHRPYPDPEDDVVDEMIQCCVCEDWYHSLHLGTEAPADYSEMVCDSCVEKFHFIEIYSKTSDVVDVDSKETCHLKMMTEALKSKDDGRHTITGKACFFDSSWRSKLCKCSDCLQLYKNSGTEFLIDETDSVEAYEKNGESNSKSQYEKGMEELSKLDRVQQIEVMSEYQDMKSKLHDYLQQFATSGEVVTKEHITAFFEQMNSQKRRRVAIPDTCR